MDKTTPSVMDKTAFVAYRALRKIADEYAVNVDPPRIVFVGETSTGKSMLVQNFLGFPCTFTSSGIATRCPVAYQLRYNPSASDRRIIKPAGIKSEDLAKYIGSHMKRVEKESQFSLEPFCVEIESDSYPDLEILDVPGLVAGNEDSQVRDAVEKITEYYVRNPKFVIILLVDTNQELANCYGRRLLSDLCTGMSNKGSGLPPRSDYMNSLCVIQTKFDLFMSNYRNGTHANKAIQDRLEYFGETYFVSMIPDGRVMTDESFQGNEHYIANLPQLEGEYIEKWIKEINRNAYTAPTNYDEFLPNYRSLIGITVVKQNIQKRWLKAFYQAAPALKETLSEQLTYANNQYTDIAEQCKSIDPKFIRENYLDYIHEFQRKFAAYAAYRPEIHNYFPTHEHGTTYEQVETGFNNWSRRQKVTWAAHLTNSQIQNMTNQNDTENKELTRILKTKIVGSSQFNRLHKLFCYMILSYKSAELSYDDIISFESYLYGALSTNPNKEKVVRDAIYIHIQKLFSTGIPWLKQMHSYILNTFRLNVTNLLLSQRKFSNLAKHNVFLTLFELDFHRKMRKMMIRAIEAAKYSRLSVSSYVNHDLTTWTKKLALRLPNSSQNESYKKIIPNIFIKISQPSNSKTTTDTYREATLTDVFANIKKPNILDGMFDSNSYLASKPEPDTNSSHESIKTTIDEIYQVISSRLADDIIKHFNTHVIVNVTNFDKMEWHRSSSLLSKIQTCSDEDISRMSNLGLEKLLPTLHYWKQRIYDLTKASVLLDSVTQQLLDSHINEKDFDIQQLNDFAQKTADMTIEILETRQADLIKSINNTRVHKTTEEDDKNDKVSKTFCANNDDKESNEDEVLFKTANPFMLEAFIRKIYQEDDNQDIMSCLLDGDVIDQDELKSRQQTLSSIKLDQNEGFKKKI